MNKREVPTFVPGRGVVVHATVKEQVQELLSGGYFDKAESAIIGVSNKEAYDCRWAGQQFDCMALVEAVRHKLYEED